MSLQAAVSTSRALGSAGCTEKLVEKLNQDRTDINDLQRNIPLLDHLKDIKMT